MSSTVKLDPKDFALPAYKAGVEVLLLLAEAINEVFSSTGTIDLLDRSEEGDWIELLALLGKLTADPQTKIVETARIGELWDNYFRQNDVKKLEAEVLDVFQAARDMSVARATATSLTQYLDAANDWGHKTARQILKKHGVTQLLPASPVVVEVFYDGPGEKYCAGSSLWTKKIRWAYQPVSHALMGVVLADFVFAHEYLSHLAARNKHLSSTIREQWLVAALRQSLEDDKLGPFWKIRLWPRYRSDLESHVIALAKIVHPDASVVRYSGFQGAEEQLRVLCMKYPDLFWKLTREILASKNNSRLASDATQIAKGLANRGLPDLDTSKINKISDLAAIIGP
jgi:hypothetical protein